MDNDTAKQVQSRNVLDFITVANELCIFLEEIEKYDAAFVFTYLQKVLPLVYLKGTLLPLIEVSHKEANERFVIEEDWQRIFNNIRTKTEDKDVFIFIDSSDKSIVEPEQGSIAEFMSDIYQDIKDFLLLYQKNTLAARENAVFNCKMLFEANWGLKLLNVHKAIHFILFGKEKESGNLFMGFSPN